MFGQWNGGQPVLFWTGSITGAWPSAAKKELNFTAMLAQFGQRLQGLLCSQELSLCVPKTLDQDITTSLTWTWSETESKEDKKTHYKHVSIIKNHTKTANEINLELHIFKKTFQINRSFHKDLENRTSPPWRLGS